MKDLKWIVTVSFMFLYQAGAFPQGAMLVEDPASIAQSAAQFCEEMTEAGDQKATLIQQLKQMIQQAKLFKDNADKYKKCMKWVKNARAAIELLDKVNALKDNYSAFYDMVRKCDWLSKKERNNLIYNANLIVTESSRIYEEAKIIVREFTEEGDAGLSSYERIQLLEQSGAKVDALNDNLDVMRVYTERTVEERQYYADLHAAMYNQYAPSDCHVDYSVK